MIGQLYAQVSVLYAYLMEKDSRGMLSIAQSLLSSFSKGHPYDEETIQALEDIVEIITIKIEDDEELELIRLASESEYKN